MNMTLLPHDLLWGLAPQQLPADAPAWVSAVLVAGQPVVVRRALVAPAMIAVGVRGNSREQRYATQMRRDQVLLCVRPEQLVTRLPAGDFPALQALAMLKPYLDSLGHCWGVTGSVGYQLASGVPVVHADSDLDLLLRTSEPLSRADAGVIVQRLDAACCRVDMQLQTPAGAVALREWAGSAPRVLLKAASGASLVSNPWQVMEQVA